MSLRQLSPAHQAVANQLMVYYELQKLLQRVDQDLEYLLAQCPDPECSTCGMLICPRGDPMHYHHDGCPSCAEDEKR